MIYARSIKQARECMALTQTAVAEALGVEQASISQWERGYMQPTPDMVERLAFHLHVPPAFFAAGPLHEFPEGSLAFRKTKGVSAMVATQLRRHAERHFAMVEHMMTQLEWPLNRLPSLRDASPADAAALTRVQLGLAPDVPIENLTKSLEKHGLLMLVSPLDAKGFDAFSVWLEHHEHRPTIVVNIRRPGDRFRFSVGHELGHIVMHRSPCGSIAQMDDEADMFAEELLMPAELIRQHLDTPVTVADLAKLKPIVKVSIQALTQRAFHLGLCTQRQYQYLAERIGKLGWRTREPGMVPLERPRSLRQMAEMVYGGDRGVIEVSKLAERLNLLPSYVQETIESYRGAKTTVERSEAAPVSLTNVVSFRNRRA
jgi:Zn-dependent peptidase ImmA (M78 family)/DNA-binding XRE family transcriptional regulator